MRWIRSSLLLATIAAGACSSGSSTVTPPPPPPTPTVDHVVIDNGNFSSIVGETRQLQVRALTATGELVTSATVVYGSSAVAVATVSATGLVTAIAPGVTTISATSSGKTASVTVTVTFPVVASISIVVARQSIKTNDTMTVVATLRDAGNAILTGRAINWQSSDSSIVLIGPTGLTFGLRAGGPVTITGSIDGLSASLSILVTPALVASVQIIPDTAVIAPDSSVQFRVEVTDEFGGTVDTPQVIWASTAAQIARVSSTGLVTGVQLGDAEILATVNGVTGQSLVHIAIPEVAKFHILVDNHLRYPVSILENGVPIGQAGANSISTIDRPLTEHATLGWTLVRPSGRGESISGSLPDIPNPTGTISMTATNVLADGRVYFTPVLRSFNGQKNPINFPIREAASLCLCAVSSEDLISRDYGYWLLAPGATMEVYQPRDGAMIGTKFVVPILPGDVEPVTGIWRYNLFIIP